MRKFLSIILIVISLILCSSYSEIGKPIDSFNGVSVYYNGPVEHVEGRHVSSTGYNFGLKWQCVEFVKRYYYQHYHHEFPYTYGHAQDFFDHSLRDIGFNKKRGLYQYRNTRKYPPATGDLVVFKGSEKNPYGHVAIISHVGKDFVEVVQQNCKLRTRRQIPYHIYKDIHTIADAYVLGWLRLY